MALNLHLVRLFAAIVNHGGFVRAARALHVSQPAISRAVRTLETQLGLSLLERGGRGVTLTAAGVELYRHATEILASERAAEETLAALRGIEGGTLHVGASVTVSFYLLPDVVAEFVRRYPKVALQVTTHRTREISEMLLAHQIDVAIVEAQVVHERLRLRPWRHDDLVPIAAPTHRLAGAKRVPPSALANEVFVLREPESMTRALVLARLASLGIAPTRWVTIGGLEALQQLVARGVGVAVVSRNAIDDALALGRLVELPIPEMTIRRELTCLELIGRTPSPAAAAFNALLDEAAVLEAPRRKGRVSRAPRRKTGGHA